MKMKRIVSAMLGLSVAATMAVGLSGCGGDKSSGDTLVWYVIGDKPDAHEKVMAKANEIIKEKIGMTLDLQYIDSASFTEKMKMKMASSEAYDLAFTGYVNDYQTAVQMGGLYDITDLIKETGLDQVIEDYYLESATINGRIYGIPNIQVISNPTDIEIFDSAAEGADIEGDLAEIEEKSNIHATYEQLQEVMGVYDRMFKKVHDAHPELYTWNPGNNMAVVGYEDIAGGVGLRKDGTSDKLEIIYETDEWKLGEEKMNEWFKAGYIRSDIASVGNAYSGTEERKKIAFTNGTWKPGQDVYVVRQYGENYKYAQLFDPYVSRKSALLTMISVGANTKHPKEAVELIKLMNTDTELYNIICWGIEGETYTKNDDGTVTIVKGGGYDDIGQNAWKYGNQFNGFRQEGQAEDVWEETARMNDEADKSPLIGFVPDLTDIQSEIANIANVDAEFKAKRGFGTEALSEWFDDYDQKMKTAGIEKVRDELQKQYDEWKASK